MDPFIELLKEINIAQIFVILGGIWIFYNRLNSKIEKNQIHHKQDFLSIEQKIEKLEQKLTQEIQKVEQKLTQEIQKVEQNVEKLDRKGEKLEEKIEDIDRRLCRIEGGLATHGHCHFNQAKPEQKAQ